MLYHYDSSLISKRVKQTKTIAEARGEFVGSPRKRHPRGSILNQKASTSSVYKICVVIGLFYFSGACF